MEEVIVLRTCECGCGEFTNLSKYQTYRPSRYIHGHQVFETNRDKDAAKLGGIALHKKHPDFAKNFLKKVRPTPEKASKLAKKLHKRRKAEDPEGYHEEHVRAGKIGIEKGGGWKKFHKDFKERDPEGYRAYLLNSLEKARLVNTDWDFYNEHGTFRSQYPYPETWTDEFREMIRDRDNNCCVITGMTQEQHLKKYGRKLIVHHWMYNKDETNSFYFVTVSVGINSMANRPKDKTQWIDLFNGIMEDKYCELMRQGV